MLANMILNALIEDGHNVQLEEVEAYVAGFDPGAFAAQITVREWDGVELINGAPADSVKASLPAFDVLVLGFHGGNVRTIRPALNADKEAAEQSVRDEMLLSVMFETIYPEGKAHFANRMPAGVPLPPDPEEAIATLQRKVAEAEARNAQLQDDNIFILEAMAAAGLI